MNALPTADGHVCASCGAPIACDWKAISDLRQHARRLNVLAGIWEAKAQGVPLGRPSVATFDVEQARRLKDSGLSYRAVAALLGTSRSNVHQRLQRERNGHEKGATR